MNQLKLYNIDQCGYCALVRETLEKLGLEYEKIDVPWAFWGRKEVIKISGQHTVPVLVDGEIILTDEYEIIEHLETKYSHQPHNK